MPHIISNISPGTEWPVTYVITILGQEKNVFVLVIARVDFDSNKKNCRPQNITRHRFHLSIIDDQRSF